MKSFIRFIALLLVIITAVSFTACIKTDDEGKANTNNATTTAAVETDDPNYDENGYWNDDIPEELDFGGTTITVLNWNSERDEFYIEEDTGDPVTSAIFTRNAQIEQRLNCKLEFTEQLGNSTNIANFVSFVDTQYQAGDSFDIIATYSRTAGSLSNKGFLSDLNSVDDSYINLEQPWYPTTLVESLSINDRLNFISGDMSTNVLHFMYGIYFNKQLFENEGIEEPYQMVKDGQWTLEEMMNLKTNYYLDMDSDSKYSVGDRYTFTSIYYNLDAFYTGSGLTLVNHSDDDILVISPDFTSAKAIDLVSTLGSWLTTNDCFVSGGMVGTVTYQDPFINGNALMCQNRVYMADNYLKEVEWKYGIVPTPKYDVSQSDYITVVGNPFTLYSIMGNSTQQTETTAVLECWSSEGYRRTTPAIFEINMQSKFSDSENDAEMFDIIHDTITFDLGRIFGADLSTSYMSEMPSKYMAKGAVWNNTAGNMITSLKTALASIAALYE